jgi:hypothetical protein
MAPIQGERGQRQKQKKSKLLEYFHAAPPSMLPRAA